MHGENIYAYGLWAFVVFNVGLFAFFLISFIAPLKKREWRSMGATLGFVVALFTEMYGFPLTIYALTAVLGSRYPALNPFSHANGHLWFVLFGGGESMMNILHLISNGLVVLGFIVMWKGWRLIHSAGDKLVTEGLYSHMRHPQYSALLLVMTGMLIQWPTLITALMFPVLVFMYYRLAKREEQDMIDVFGDQYRDYMEHTPMFIPRLKARPSENDKSARTPAQDTNGALHGNSKA